MGDYGWTPEPWHNSADPGRNVEPRAAAAAGLDPAPGLPLAGGGVRGIVAGAQNALGARTCMKIANRLRFSWSIMVAAILATALLAVGMMFGGGTATAGDDTGAQQVALAEVGDRARAHGVAAMSLALGSETDETKLVDAGTKLQEAVQRAAKVSPAAKDLPQALSEYAQGTDAALKAVKDAATATPMPAAGGAK